MLVSKNLIELVAVAVILTFRTERIAGLDLLLSFIADVHAGVAHGRMSGDPGIFSLSRRRFVQALAMLAAQARWPLRLAADGNDTAPLELWYDRPASQWVEALPIGNGRLGAMIFGEASDASTCS